MAQPLLELGNCLGLYNKLAFARTCFPRTRHVAHATTSEQRGTNQATSPEVGTFAPRRAIACANSEPMGPGRLKPHRGLKKQNTNPPRASRAEQFFTCTSLKLLATLLQKYLRVLRSKCAQLACLTWPSSFVLRHSTRFARHMCGQTDSRRKSGT